MLIVPTCALAERPLKFPTPGGVWTLAGVLPPESDSERFTVLQGCVVPSTLPPRRAEEAHIARSGKRRIALPVARGALLKRPVPSLA